ncbi:MAG: protein-glutamate O-methyltransferase CheR [Phycisphaerales bacterium]|nr:protein-glutamate O-methyltransferase CheR [Phycisphaerales bacterium]
MSQVIQVGLQLTEDEFARMARMVYDRTGIHLPVEKRGMLSNRLRKRLRALNMDSFGPYFELLKSKEGCEEELPNFLSAVTTNETYFFRNEQLWQYLGGELIPALVAARGPRAGTLRFWSAASSSGEEAYTLAILLRETIPEVAKWSITIIASDISSRMLDKARGGVYNDYAVAKTPPALVEKYFEAKDGAFHLKEEARRMVRFQFHNLRDPFPNGKFDVVFLRNVLMYFDNAMKIRVLGNITDALAPGGRLIVGDVDPIRTVAELNATLTLDYERPGVYVKPTRPAVRTLAKVNA